MTAPAIAAGMASPASLLGVLFHHGPERLDPGRQTEPIKADRNGVPRFAHSPIPVGGEAINVVLTFFMALLSFRGFDTPSLPAQGEQRRSSYFNIPRGNSAFFTDKYVSSRYSAIVDHCGEQVYHPLKDN
jgi:hypothetical protein